MTAGRPPGGIDLPREVRADPPTARRARQMVVQGVRPITQAVEHSHKADALLLDHRPCGSRWAEQLLTTCRNVPVIHVPADLMAGLGGHDDGPPEILGPGENAGR